MDFDDAESIRQGINDLVTDQDAHPEKYAGKWRIEASLVHNPVPWGNGIHTTDLSHHLRGVTTELLLIELGYRAAWRMCCETDCGHSDRFVRALRRRCEDEGHDFKDYLSGSMANYARKYGFTKACPRCGHTDGETCRCSFCSRPGGSLRRV